MSAKSEIERHFRDLETRIERLKKAEADLMSMGTSDWRGQHKSEISAIMTSIKDTHKVDEVEQGLAALKARLTPSITVSMSDAHFEHESWSTTELILENPGPFGLTDIAISLSGDIELGGLDRLAELAGGDRKELPIRLKPLKPGEVPLRLSVSFRDKDGNMHSSDHDFILEVAAGSPKAQPPGSVPKAPFFPEDLYALYSSAELIGQGGFARVYRARRKKDDCPVAVKIPIDVDPAVGKAFLTEIENWKKLSHENIVRLLDFNISPAVYLELELCHHSMANLTMPVQAENACFLVLEVARGLAHAHAKGVIHRDLKPSNILMKDNNPMISDWGLSRVKSASVRSISMSFSPLYAAPEQYSPKTFGKTDERTDIYQIGTIFYELISGTTPFTGEDFAEISFAIANNNPEPPSALNPESVGVERIIMKCLQKKKENRYQSIDELQVDMAGFLGIDLKKTLTLSRNTLEKIKLCTDLVEIHAYQGNCERCLMYLRTLEGIVRGSDLKDVIHEEIQALQFHARQEVSMADRIPRLDEIIHRARIGN
ncbi:MAG: serine/threonine-protein kinase [Dehalococcoidia bacterium]